MLAGALFLTACSHNSSLPPFTASGFAEDQGAVRIWRKDSGDNVHLLAVFSPWRSGDTTTREYRWQGDNLTLININVYSKPPVNIRARFDDRGDLSFMQRESDGEKQQLSNSCLHDCHTRCIRKKCPHQNLFSFHFCKRKILQIR